MKRVLLLGLLGGSFSLAIAQSNPAQPLTLADAHALALRNHPRVAAAQIQAAIAQEMVRESRSGLFPTVSAYADGVEAGNENTRILAGGLNNPSIYDRIAGGLAVSQLVTDFGRTRNLAAESKFEAKAQLQNVAATREQTLLSVDVSYFAFLEAQAVLRVAGQTLAARQYLVDQVTALASHQLRSDLDVSFSQVALEEARLLQQKAEGDTQSAQASLAAALGYGGTAAATAGPTPRWQLVEPPPPAPPPGDLDAAVTSALANRPDIIRLRDERDAALRFARSENDLNYPTVSAVGTVGAAAHYDAHLPQHYAAGGLLLNLPLFTGGLYAGRQHAASLKAQAADEAIREAENDADRDVRIAWSNLRTADQRLLTTAQLFKHAVQAEQLAQARYKAGSSSIVELSQGELNRTSAEISQTSARYDYLIARSVLDYQMGALK